MQNKDGMNEVGITVVPAFTGPSDERTPAMSGHFLNVRMLMSIDPMRGHLMNADSGHNILVICPC